MRIALLLVCVFALVAPAVGCNGGTLSEQSMLSPGYFGRHVKQILNDFHSFRIDCDRVFFGLEDAPIEEW